jgi:tetratricopeptide (TPR) repeat protein
MSRIEKILEFLKSSPEGDSFLEHALALEYIKIGEEEKAEVLFRTLLLRDPGYTGSYYHLGKLLERKQLHDEALIWYEKGMEACKKSGDQHAFSELRGAYDELAF